MYQLQGCILFRIPPCRREEGIYQVIWEGFKVVEKEKKKRRSERKGKNGRKGENKKGKKKGKKMELMNRIKERKMGSFPRSMEQYKSLIIGFGCFFTACPGFSSC